MSKQASIAIIVPYFGSFPNYFDLWLKTAEFQKGLVDFLLFTDCQVEQEIIPSNVRVIDMDYNEVEKRVNSLLPFKVKMYSPYKITDYKPLYGKIFSDYLKEYDFWGFCDVDLIWGNLAHFITHDVLKNYDRIYSRGHLELFRNLPKITNAVIDDYSKYHTLENTMGVSIKDIFSHSYAAHFDEGPHLQAIMSQPRINARNYIHYDMADIKSTKKQFICINPIDNSEEAFAYFKWENGVLSGYRLDGTFKEFAYAHLQKRKMSEQTVKDEGAFLIIPNKFIKVPSVIDSTSTKVWSEEDKDYEKSKLNYFKWLRFKHIFNGGGILRLKEKIHQYRAK